MQRELKFRVFHSEKGLNDIYGFDKKYVYLDTYDSAEYLENILPIEDCTLEQFTGLTDKNGKDIYEGDVVSNKQIKGKVSFNGACFVVYDKNSDFILLYKCNPATLEVIGNIHENKNINP